MREGGRLASRGDKNEPALEIDCPLSRIDQNPSGLDNPARSRIARNLVLAKERLDTFGKNFYRFFLASHDRGKIELEILGANAMLGEILLGSPEDLARFQERLTRNAADAQAGSAEFLLPFHASNVQPQLRRADGGHVSSRTAANDDEIV